MSESRYTFYPHGGDLAILKGYAKSADVSISTLINNAIALYIASGFPPPPDKQSGDVVVAFSIPAEVGLDYLNYCESNEITPHVAARRALLVYDFIGFPNISQLGTAPKNAPYSTDLGRRLDRGDDFNQDTY